MTVSRSCSYGLWAMIYLASQPEGQFVPIRRISNELGISFHFLTKILQKLTDDGLLLSLRGTNGGVALARRKADINLMDIIEAIDGPGVWNGCYLGLPGCSDENPCPMHAKWKQLRADLIDFLTALDLTNLTESIEVVKSKLQVGSAEV